MLLVPNKLDVGAAENGFGDVDPKIFDDEVDAVMPVPKVLEGCAVDPKIDVCVDGNPIGALEKLLGLFCGISVDRPVENPDDDCNSKLFDVEGGSERLVPADPKLFEGVMNEEVFFGGVKDIS